MRPRSEHLTRHPHLARLLLREGIRAKPRAERLMRAIGIDATEMIALAAAIIENGLAAVTLFDRAKLLRDLCDRRIPIDLFERTSARRRSGMWRRSAAR